MTKATFDTLSQAFLLGEPTIHAQSRRFAGFEWARKRLHAVLSHENSSVDDVEEYTKTRDLVNHAYECNQMVGTSVSHFPIYFARRGSSVTMHTQPWCIATLRTLPARWFSTSRSLAKAA